MEYISKCCSELGVLELKRGYRELAHEYLLFASECSFKLGDSKENMMLNGDINSLKDNQNIKQDNFKDDAGIAESAIHTWPSDVLSVFEDCSNDNNKQEEYISYLSQIAERLSSQYLNPLSISEI
jgi:hypothetical protein